MQFNGKKSVISAVILAATLPGISWAEDAEPLSQRVERLERIIQGQGLMNLITRVDQLQAEVKRLNGENESLRHELEQMQKRQREMYIDLDERLQKQAQAAPPQPVMPVTDGETPVITDTPDETTDSGQLPSPDSAPAAVESGEAAYQAALQTLRSGQYEQAIAALQAFPEQYPGSTYLPNVYYWQGEAKYVLREFADAAALFQIVIDQYPSSSKVPDALLKRGFSEQEMGDSQRATNTMQQVIDLYPDSSAAKLAKARLERSQ
jgi:tol-pal system protein YbgF